MTGENKADPHKELFWRIGRDYRENSGVLRVGDYKLIVKNEKVQLFNLKKDLSETIDLSQKKPKKVKKTLAHWQTLNASSQPPLWKSLSKAEGSKDEYQYKDYRWLKGSPHYRAKKK